MIFTNSLLLDLLGVVLVLVAIAITFFKRSFQYWPNRNVPQIEPSIPFGNSLSLFRKHDSIGVHMKKLYDQIKGRGLKAAGIYMFSNPLFYPVDPDYIKSILTKDFQHFTDRGIYVNERDDPIGAHLFALGGLKWRNLRTKLSPTFTSGKLKSMFQTLVDCEDSLLEVMDQFYDKREPIDIKEVLGCFTTDIIGSCAFGLDCNTFKETDSPFRKYGKKVFESTVPRRIKGIIGASFPKLAIALRLRQIPKDISDFFTKVVSETVEYREKNHVARKDFLQLLLELKNNELSETTGYQHDGKTLTIDEIVAQSFIFFLAGFETSSTTMTFALYELAKHEDIQEKVRREVNEVLAQHGGKMTYDSINDMKYMNQVIDETLRKYPPVPFVTRECVKEYKVPDSNLIIEKGVKVLIPILGLHWDPEYYPDPEKFDPERFSEVNKHGRHPYVHIPFGEGPRICIGLRFGIMQSKVGLTSLLKNYKFTVNKKTEEPLKIAPNTFILTAKGDVWLDAAKISK